MGFGVNIATTRSVPFHRLAAVVIAAAIGLFEVTDLKRIYRIQQWEFWLSICSGANSSFE
jgi:hypothetical protein